MSTAYDKHSIGLLLRERRSQAGLSQRKLGEACGYQGRSAEVTVQRWEAGSRPIPLDKLRPLSDALNIPLDRLIP